MGRGVILNVEIPKYVMKNLTLAVKKDQRPLPFLVKEILNAGLEQWAWGKIAGDMIEHVQKNNPSKEEKQEMLRDFAGLVHEVMEGGKKKKAKRGANPWHARDE